ncbi:MAG: hypothetical protein EA364_16295 [Balneolaceae bacterium]|nr:MAG: hypothetical protein EA364_16295 [Balneolaceae bacterium]
MKPFSAILIVLTAAVFLFAACGPEKQAPHPGPSIKTKVAGDIVYGADQCDWCHKPIETVRYGAELVRADGKILKFRAVEHLAAWMVQNGDEAGKARSVLVVDFADGKNMIGPKEALYLRSTLRPSPGQLHITPIHRNNERMLTNIYEAYPGTFMEWDELLELVKANMDVLAARQTGN